MGIYKRGQVYWIDFYDQNRKRIQESSQSPHRRDAESLYTLRNSEALRGIYKQPVKISLGTSANAIWNMRRRTSGLGCETNICSITFASFSAKAGH